MWKLLRLTDEQWEALADLCTYIQEWEEDHYDECEPEEQECHIYPKANLVYDAIRKWDAFRDIVKEIHQHEEYLNSKDDDDEYQFFHYMSECNQAWCGFDTPLEAVQNVDFDNIDFNIWFEQWYLRGMEVIQNLFSDNKNNES